MLANDYSCSVYILGWFSCVHPSALIIRKAKSDIIRGIIIAQIYFRIVNVDNTYTTVGDR